MAAREREEDFEFTRDEIDRFSDALKDKEFRKLLIDYCEEIQDPANRAQYQSEITELEKQRGVDVTFLNPSPGYVIKSSVGGEKKAFINVCSNDNVEKPSFSVQENNGKKGVCWRIPHTMAPPHDDMDKRRNRCVVYDVIFHPSALRMAHKNAQFKNVLNSTSCDAIESNYNVKLDRKNIKFPKLQYKGVAIPSVVRKPIDNFEEHKHSEEDAELIDKLYPQSSFPSKTSSQCSKSSSKSDIDECNDNDTQYTIPKYVLIQRRDIQMSDFTYDRDAKQDCAIPSALVLEVNMPLLSSSADAVLEVKEKNLILVSEKPAKYRLQVKLPYKVDDEAGSAKFDVSKKQLTIVLPVVTENKSIRWLGREDSGVESDCNSPCISDEDNTHNLDTVSQTVQVLSEDDSYRTNSFKLDEFLNAEISYLVPPYTCHVLDNTVALTLHIKNVDPVSVSSRSLYDNNCVQLKFSSLGAGYFPIHYALMLKFPSCFKCEPPIVETWDNNVIMQLLIEGSHLPDHYWIGLNEEQLERKTLDIPVENVLFPSDVPECKETIQPSVEVSARGNNEVNISVTVPNQEENEQNEELKQNIIPIPIKTDDTFDIGIASSTGSSKGILKSKTPRIGRSFSESSVDFMEYCGSPAYSISSADCIPEESSSLKKTVRFSNVIAKQTFRTNSSILGQKTKNQRKKRNKKRAQERRASEGDPEDGSSMETASDENAFSDPDFKMQSGDFTKERRDSGLADTDEGDQDREDYLEESEKVDDSKTFKLPSYLSKTLDKGKYQEIKFKNDLIFDLDM